jgi:hypothetical protein
VLLFIVDFFRHEPRFELTQEPEPGTPPKTLATA